MENKPLGSRMQFLWILRVVYFPVKHSCLYNKRIYHMEESVLLGTKPLVDSIRHFIRDPSGVSCRIVQWRHDSRILLLLNWFLHIIKRTLHVGSKIWILCCRSLTREILFLPLEHKIHIFLPPCNILYICVLQLKLPPPFPPNTMLKIW